MKERKFADLAAKFVAPIGWVCPDIGKFATVGAVDRPRRDCDVCG